MKNRYNIGIVIFLLIIAGIMLLSYPPGTLDTCTYCKFSGPRISAPTTTYIGFAFTVYCECVSTDTYYYLQIDRNNIAIQKTDGFTPEKIHISKVLSSPEKEGNYTLTLFKLLQGKWYQDGNVHLFEVKQIEI